MEYQSKDITIEGKKIYYETNSGQEMIVFLHGANTNLTVFNSIREHFANKGFGTIAIDLRGHGKSCNLNSKREFSLENCRKDVELVLEKECVKSPIVVGSSTGGMIAQCYASKNETKALVLISTSYDLKTTYCRGLKRKIMFRLGDLNILAIILANKLIGAKEKIYPNYCNEKYGKTGIAKFIYLMISQHNAETIQNNSHISRAVITWNTLPYLININAPCIVISGDNDVIVPLPTAYELAELLPNCKETIIIKNANHGIGSAQTEEIIQAMERFFNVSIEKN